MESMEVAHCQEAVYLAPHDGGVQLMNVRGQREQENCSESI